MEDTKNSEPEMKNELSAKKRLSESIMLQFIGIGISFLYLFGFLYNQGYLVAYGSSLDVFPQSADQYFVSLFLIVAETVLTNLEEIKWLFIAVLAVFLLPAITVYSISLGVEKFFQRLVRTK